MKFNVSVTVISIVIALSLISVLFRVHTAPERIRQRLNTARDTCTSTGGQWVEATSAPWCRPPLDGKKT